MTYPAPEADWPRADLLAALRTARVTIVLLCAVALVELYLLGDVASRCAP